MEFNISMSNIGDGDFTRDVMGTHYRSANPRRNKYIPGGRGKNVRGNSRPMNTAQNEAVWQRHAAWLARRPAQQAPDPNSISSIKLRTGLTRKAIRARLAELNKGAAAA